MHILFSRVRRSLKAFEDAGTLALHCEARNDTVNPGFGHWGHCPSGEFVAGTSIEMDAPAFGHWFVPLSDAPGHHAFLDHARRGIGFHGGGTGLKAPMASRQGWRVTHGCIRLQNEDLEKLVALIHAARARGEVVRVTVSD